jgi:DNA-directed RNA polymerase specialized sigma24 family protein
MRAPLKPGAAARAQRLTAHVEKLDWGEISARLTRYAYGAVRRRSHAQAEDLAQKAIMEVLDPMYMEWDPEREPDIFEHLKNVVRGAVSNLRQRRERRHVVAADLDVVADYVAAEGPTPEDELAGAEGVATLEARLATMFDGDALVTKLIALAIDGTQTARDQAVACGVPIGEIRNARKRLFRGTAELAKELGLGQEVEDGG